MGLFLFIRGWHLFYPSEDQLPTELNNELLPGTAIRDLMRWTAIVGIPVVLGVGNGIRAFLKTFVESTGSDFIFEVSVFSFFGGCFIGGCIGLAASVVVFLATRRVD